MNSALLDALKRDEGTVLDSNGWHRPYQDSMGIWTIGYGHNSQASPISPEAADRILADDAAKAEAATLHEWPWVRDLDQARQNVLINMVFNMGLAKVRGFKNFLSALERHDYETAAKEMLDSVWAKQVGARAVRLAAIIRG